VGRVKARYHVARALGEGIAVVRADHKLIVPEKVLVFARPVHPVQPANHAKNKRRKHQKASLL